MSLAEWVSLILELLEALGVGTIPHQRHCKAKLTKSHQNVNGIQTMRTKKLKPHALAKAVATMKEKGYDIAYISARLHQNCPPVFDKTVKGWLEGTSHPSREQCSYLPSILHTPEEVLFDVTE